MVDYNHAKVIADQGAVVSASSTFPLARRTVSASLDIMEFTDGLNEIYARVT